MFRTLSLILLLLPAALRAEVIETSAGPVQVKAMLTGLNQPWAVAFLPDGGVLATLREGKLLRASPGREVGWVSGVPEVAARGQGGLLDVAVARDFAESGEIFLTYSEPRDGGAATALAVAKLDLGADRLSDVRVIFRMNHASGSTKHFGSRVVEAREGTLFVTVGERGDRPLAQDVERHNGKVIRVNRDGSIPADNPFSAGGGLPEIWSWGHRNPQGAALDAEGRLWIVEHGAKGGDEINRPEAGRNYGWPVISYGRHYSGGKIGEGTAKVGMEQPAFYWDPSIAPSGMMIYSGKLWPEWAGDIFVGSLKFDMISRVEVDGSLREAERLFQDRFNRIRDVREGPDGAIWFLSVGDGALYRVTPG
jgi:glucose/arabinose dehydrogenase